MNIVGVATAQYGKLLRAIILVFRTQQQSGLVVIIILAMIGSTMSGKPSKPAGLMVSCDVIPGNSSKV